MGIRILMIDDDEKLCKQTEKILYEKVILNDRITLEYSCRFDEGEQKLKEKNYDLLILDLYKGEPGVGSQPGEYILQRIKKSFFIPVIFFSAVTKPIEDLKSHFVRVVNKNRGNEALEKEIELVLESELHQIRRRIHEYVTKSTTSYLWDFVEKQWNFLEKGEDKVSLDYILMRRLANSLSKEQIGEFLKNHDIKNDETHPMEFYVYPPVRDEYEMGDILNKEGMFFVLTPSCDFVERNGRKAEKTMLLKIVLLKNTKEYESFKISKSNNKRWELKEVIASKKDRYFFLPKTPFMDHSVIDFQDMIVIPTSELGQYEKVAKIDNPFAEAVLSKFIRYYNRVGFPDINSDHIIDNL